MNVALLSQPQRELRAYLQRVAGDGGTVETPGEASTFIRRLRSAGVLGSTVIAGVAGGVKAGTLYSIIGPDLDVTRGTVKNRVNRAGVLSEVASGVPATDFAGGVLRGTTVEPSAVNQIRNNTMQGAVVGVVGSGGALPTNWAIINVRGLAVEVVSIGSEIGVDYIDIRLNGTATSTGNAEIRLEGLSQIAASSGQTWNFSSYVKNIANVDASAFLGLVQRTNTTIFVTRTIVDNINTGALSRFNVSGSISDGTVAFVVPQVGATVNNGQSYDFTIRIGLPQMELGSVATSVIKTTGSAQPRNADVITKTGLGSVLPQTEGWVYAEVDYTNGGAVKRYLTISSENNSNNLVDVIFNASNALVCRTRQNSFNVGEITTGSLAFGRYKILYRFANNHFAMYANGQKIGEILSGSVSFPIPLQRIAFANANTTSDYPNDPIHSYAIGSGAITDAQAIQLTTL
jgi:hypothetical protein